MRIILPLLSILFLVSCNEEATTAQRIAFAQKHYNTTEVVKIDSGTVQSDLLVRDQSNQVWRIFVDAKLRIESAIIIFPSEKGKAPTYPSPTEMILIEPTNE